ncbi:MAG: lipid-A-disaccharide synthase [Bacteroidia bacterium]
MKLYFIAGEDSGDLHTKNLIKALKQEIPSLQTRGVGGELMRSVGTELVAHIEDINFMGFWEVITNLKTIRQLFRTVKEDIEQWQPDAVVLIDYPGFNLRMAKYLKEKGLRIIYYISPQVWAWKKGRVKTIRQYVDQMLVILPFEKDFYKKEGVDVDFVGHPLLDEIECYTDTGKKAPIVALLPGSRQQEIKRMLPVMLKMIPQFPDYEFVIAGAPSQKPAFYEAMIGNVPVKLIMNQTYEVLSKAQYALVTSGTATLETALFDVPQVVCYKGSPISYHIGKYLVQVRFISLVNLILNQPLVKELIQAEFNTEKLSHALKNIMDPVEEANIKNGYVLLRHQLGDKGASTKAAQLIISKLGESTFSK